MLWFEGQIAEAISRAKQQKSLFVVYISGTNEDSDKMNQTWEDEEVSRTCEESNLVVMKFQNSSEECKQFSVFYPVICVPCVYLISGENGTLLESVAGWASASDLVQKIKSVVTSLKEGRSPGPPSTQPEEGKQASGSTSVTTATASQPEPAKSSQSAPSTGSAATAKATAPSGVSPSTSSERQESAHERAARMRQKLEEAHRKKEEQRKQAEKDKELERRRVGQEIQRSDQTRSEQQARQLAEDLRRQRREDKMAREKVLEQLARDKAEKAAHFQTERERRETQRLQAQQEKEAAQRSEEARRAASRMDTATVQFRLPDGTTMTNQFESAAPLQEALDYVTERVGASLKEFTLSMTYPRRNFGPDDMQTSLLDHGLAPRAAIVVLPGRLIPTYQRSSSPSSSSSSSSSSSGGGLFSWLLAPFLVIYNFIMTLLFGTAPSTSAPLPPSPGTPQASSGAAQAPSSGEEDSPRAERGFRDMGARPKSSYARRRAPPSGGSADSFSRREGNIHRLNTQQADNDENNTWNGNSTQQM